MTSDDDFLRAVARAPAIGVAHHASPQLVGKKLGRYEIVAPLGRGGMGLVYRARDVVLRRDVAVKILPPDLVDDESRKRRFLREARLAAALVHPNIATVFDVGEEAEHVFLAMELVRGSSLRDRVHGRLEPDEIIRLATAIAAGIVEAHAAGIVHRDLKPENVIASGTDVVKVLDFGLAKLRGGGGHVTNSSVGTEPGRVLGTPAYMSPEQARGADVDERTDVFSFGVLVFELATGKRPFEGDTLTDILVAHRCVAHESIAAHRRDLPRALSDLVDDCLHVDPKVRPSMRVVSARLRSVHERRRPAYGTVVAVVVTSVLVLVLVVARCQL